MVEENIDKKVDIQPTQPAPAEQPKVEEQPNVETKVEEVTVSDKEIEAINKEVEAKEKVLIDKAKEEGKTLGLQEAKIAAMTKQLEEQQKKMADLEKIYKEEQEKHTQRKGIVPDDSFNSQNTQVEKTFADYSENELKEAFGKYTGHPVDENY